MKSLRLHGLLLLSTFLCFVFLATAQEKVISGKVIDQQTSLPLEGVTVKVKNSNVYAMTNKNGEFTLKAPSNQSVITFTYVGYGIFEVKAGSITSLPVSLEVLDQRLDEVVVVGYGTQKRTHLTGSVGTINVKSIQDLPVGNLSEALKGQIVGVSVSGGFSRPGEPATITIRNPIYYSKDGGSKEPLYIIDDIVRTKADFDLLDATEVDNISVLKDAAAAIYGILGSNGVIVVKTKRGKSGGTSISYSTSYGISDAPMMPKMMNGYEQAMYLNDYLGGSKNWDTAATSALSGYYTPDELEHFQYHNYDWLSKAWQKSFEMRHT
ncbi:MAG: carboxypeptidase-like regulatory domain-containing protein, partial [Chitinophagaceae bacterium]